MMAGRSDTTRHLLVWITSNVESCQVVQYAKSENFDVVVLYNSHLVSNKPDSAPQVATASCEWLEFLRRQLSQSQLSISSHKQSGYSLMHPMPPPPDQHGDAVPGRQFHSIGPRPWSQLQPSQPGAGSAAPPTQSIVALTGLLAGKRSVRLQCYLLLSYQLEDLADQTPVAIMQATHGETIALLYFGYSTEHCPEQLANHVVNVLGGVVFDSMHIKADIYPSVDQSVDRLEWTVAEPPANTSGRAQQANAGSWRSGQVAFSSQH